MTFLHRSKTGSRTDSATVSVRTRHQGEILLVMKDICKDYYTGGEQQRVLKNINLTLKRGQYLGILGPSGSGKSTLMNIIGCLDVPTSGEYWLDGNNIEEEDEIGLSEIRNKEVGFIFQSYYLLQKQTARENVELPLIYANVPAKERSERVEQALEAVGLADRMDYYPNQMSGGQQQRVAIARAMVNHPSILLADEPTGALDQRTGAQVMDLFGKLNEEGNTIIMITHDAHIAAHAKRIVRILDGVISEGRVEDA